MFEYFWVMNGSADALGTELRDTPELAIPYSLPVFMARCALASLVDAIIFIDYSSKTQYSPARDEKAPYFGDFLNVSDRLEPQLDFAEGSHIARILGASAVTVSLLCGETSDGLSGKHVPLKNCRRRSHSENIGHQRAEYKTSLPDWRAD